MTAHEEAAADPGPVAAVSEALTRDPRPFYRMLRDTSPVLRINDTCVVVSTWPLIDEVLHSPSLFRTSQDANDFKNERPLVPLQINPPEHAKYRKILDPLFSPKKIKPRKGAIVAVANRLIDRFIDSAEIDFAQAFSIPFPAEVFLTLLGLPPEELPALLAMKDGLIRPNLGSGKPMGHPETDALQKATASSVYAYFERVVADRRLHRRDDLLSWLLDAEVDGKGLSHNDILDISFLCLLGGLDTVEASLACFFDYLIRNDHMRQAIVEDPSVIPAVVEELLRWESPIMSVGRQAVVDTEIAGCPVNAGDRVLLMLGSANTDETNNPNAVVPQLDRKINRHVSFGGGAHRCLGSYLARTELRVALEVWHQRIPLYDIKPGAELTFWLGTRSVETFPMLLHRRAHRVNDERIDPPDLTPQAGQPDQA
jgi:cytochrome P450